MSFWSVCQPAAGWTIHLAATAKGLCRLNMATTSKQFLKELAEAFPGVEWTRKDDYPVLRKAAVELEEYFRGERARFEVPLDMRGTPFQIRVWQALRQIPFGQTRSYSELARAVGKPKASRAVGGANGRNPIGIVVPCHRVIAASGGLGGFGCGLEYKKKLLDLESRPVAPA